MPDTTTGYPVSGVRIHLNDDRAAVLYDAGRKWCAEDDGCLRAVTAPHPLRHVVNPRYPVLRAWLNGPVRASFWISVGVTMGLIATVPFLIR